MAKIKLNKNIEIIEDLIEQLYKGDLRAIGRLMTLVENNIEIAEYVIKKIYQSTKNAFVIGITGFPGGGKSTLINAMLDILGRENKKVGVICIDPSSVFSGGSLLGDRIRMKRNFNNPNFFIRSMANRCQLGGLARATKDMIKILEAAGYDFIIIETVGVGQSEIEIFHCSNIVILVLVPNLGDEIQTLKAGIMEITDIFVINKMDLEGADRLFDELNSMIELNYSIQFKSKSNWRPSVLKINALKGENVEKLIDEILNYKKFIENSNELRNRLMIKYKKEVLDIMKYKLTKEIEQLIFHNEYIDKLINKIISKEVDSYTISEKIISELIHNR